MRLVRDIILLFSMSSVCFGPSARQIAKTAFRSVVLLEMNDANGQPLSLGSRFFVAEGVVATNAHVIEGASSGTVKLIGNDRKSQIVGTLVVDRHADLALLRVHSTAPSLPLGPATTPTVGDPVYVVGNPLGLEGTFSEGIISGVRKISSDSILQMTAPISPGSSGGPVMDSAGSVIGVSVATFQDGQNLNLAVPVSYLAKLLAESSTVVTPLLQHRSIPIPEKSMLNGLGAHPEAGIVVSGFKMDDSGDYSFRLSNRLPGAVSDVRVRIIYYDVSAFLMDFEDCFFSLTIPAGLTKTVQRKDCTSHYDESYRAANYYRSNGTLGSGALIASPVDTKHIEQRVISFRTNESQ